MNESVKMVLVLTLIASFSGGTLAGVRSVTKDRIEYQQLKYEKEPVIMKILAEAANDPMKDRFKLKDGETDITVFPGLVNNKKVAVLEAFGKGFSGDIGLLVGIDLENETITKVGVTTHTETPGFGSRAKEEPFLAAQFEDRVLSKAVSVKKDGGEIDSISGATITTRGVCVAVNEAAAIFSRIRPELKKQFESSVKGGQ